MKQISVSDDTHAALLEFAAKDQAAADKEQEAGQIVDAIIAGIKEYQSLPALLSQMRADADAAAAKATKAVAADLRQQAAPAAPA